MFRAALPVLVSVTVCDPLVVFNVWLANVKLEVDKLTTGAGALAPVPLRVKECGLPAALSEMVTAAVREPAAVGVNVTVKVQLPLLAATELPQLFNSVKSPMFAPVTLIPVMLSAAVPMLVSVTDCEPLVVFTCWLGNVKLEADKLTAGAGEPEVPVPVSGTTCGLSGELSVKISDPVRTPGAVGVNVTQISQLKPWDNPLPQKLVRLKSPVVEMLLMVRNAAPTFLKLKIVAWVVEPTA